jgi:hypothetical protein
VRSLVVLPLPVEDDWDWLLVREADDWEKTWSDEVGRSDDRLETDCSKGLEDTAEKIVVEELLYPSVVTALLIRVGCDWLLSWNIEDWGMTEADKVWRTDDKLEADNVNVSGTEEECCWLVRLESTMLSKTLAVADRLDMILNELIEDRIWEVSDARLEDLRLWIPGSTLWEGVADAEFNDEIEYIVWLDSGAKVDETSFWMLDWIPWEVAALLGDIRLDEPLENGFWEDCSNLEEGWIWILDSRRWEGLATTVLEAVTTKEFIEVSEDGLWEYIDSIGEEAWVCTLEWTLRETLRPVVLSAIALDKLDKDKLEVLFGSTVECVSVWVTDLTLWEMLGPGKSIVLAITSKELADDLPWLLATGEAIDILWTFVGEGDTDGSWTFESMLVDGDGEVVAVLLLMAVWTEVDVIELAWPLLSILSDEASSWLLTSWVLLTGDEKNVR